MKLRLILLLSVLANVALARALWLRSQHPAEMVQRETANAIPVPAQASAETSRRGVAAAPMLPPPLPPTDDKGFVAYLRAAGFREDTIRQVIYRRVYADGHYRERLEAILKSIEKPYWRTTVADEIMARESSVERRAFYRDLEDAVNRIAGFPPGKDPVRLAELYPGIPPEKILMLRAIEDDYGNLTALVEREARSVMLPIDQARLDYLEKEERADLARLLTAEELNAYDRRGHAPLP